MIQMKLPELTCNSQCNNKLFVSDIFFDDKKQWLISVCEVSHLCCFAVLSATSCTADACMCFHRTAEANNAIKSDLGDAHRKPAADGLMVCLLAGTRSIT